MDDDTSRRQPAQNSGDGRLKPSGERPSFGDATVSAEPEQTTDRGPHGGTGPQPHLHQQRVAERKAREAAELAAARPAQVPEQTAPGETLTPATPERAHPQQQQRPQPATRPIMIKATASRARPKRRHWMLLVTLLLIVILPTCGAGFYLYRIAVDQYHSTVGFSVRKEEISSPVDILGAGITNLSGSQTSDTDILYEFIQSQEMVEAVDAKLDLRTLYSKPDYDPVFAFDPTGSREDLVDYWNRVVRIFYDSGTQLIELRVTAFEPEDAQNITQAIFEESSRMINNLSAIARADATRYAREELDRAEARLRDARLAVQEFRSKNQIVDVAADIQGQTGLITSLEAQQAEALIEFDVTRDANPNDPRLTALQRRIDVIAARIDSERGKLGVSDTGDRESYAILVGRFEALTVDREFAETTYTTTLAAFDAAVSEAQRQSRYLAAYIQPTQAEESRYPQREVLLAMVFGFMFLVWALIALIFYSIRDRR